VSTLKKTFGRSAIALTQGDITALAVDAIVNAANKQLQHGGGVALAIVRKGGRVIQEESDKLAPIETGDAVITTGGKLPAKFVIHAVGPIWGEGDEDNKLRLAIQNSLKLADEKGLKTIAFPAISTGIYRFPVERAAEILLKTAKNYLETAPTKLETVTFCLFDKHTYDVFAHIFAEL
jgi:O-acetyl-ADP-ribose deacetylase (regulator of RNase III)